MASISNGLRCFCGRNLNQSRNWTHARSNFGSIFRLYSNSTDKKENGNSKAKLGLAVFCGAAMSLGYYGYKKYYDDMGKIDLFEIKNNFAYSAVPQSASCTSSNKDEEKLEPKLPSDCEDGECTTRIASEEKSIEKSNFELEAALQEAKHEAVHLAEEANAAYCESAKAIKEYMDKAYNAIEEEDIMCSNYEELWCAVFDASKFRCEKIAISTQKGQSAWEALCLLSDIINEGKKCKYTECNPLLITAEDFLCCAKNELVAAKNKIDCMLSESRLVEQYSNIVEDFRKDLKAEIESLLTSDPVCRATLTDNECNMILTHAYKKILRVQKELAEAQANYFSGDSEKENEVIIKAKMEELKEVYDKELVKALSLQAQVYQESWEQSKNQLTNEYERRVKQGGDLKEAEHLLELRSKYGQASAALAAMEKTLRERKDAEIMSESSRRLWAYCNSIYNQLNFGGMLSSEEAIKIDREYLLKEFANDEFAMQLLKVIPDQVGSSEKLKERYFTKVEKTCRKLALFKDGENITLWKYLLGNVQAAFVSRCEGEKDSTSSVFEILDRTSYFMRRGELLNAVITLNKIRGVPRVVCKDWLLDARQLLETNQTLFALMNHATIKNMY